MDKNTLSNYGWIVIAVLVLSVMIALATPFGEYIQAGVESTTAGLFETSEKALNVVGMSAGNGNFESNSGDIPEIENNPAMWERGGYTGTGSFFKSANIIATIDYVPEDTHLVYAENNYKIFTVVYDENDNFLGFWNGSNIVQSGNYSTFYINPAGFAPYKVKILVKKNDSTNITVEECSNIHFLNKSSADKFAPMSTLTFIDDDGAKEALLNWESICDELKINVTAALVTSGMGEGKRASWDDVERLQNKGFEFVSHTHNHLHIGNSTEEQCRQSFESSITALREHGCEYRYLVYPYDGVTSTDIPLIKQYFSAGVSGNHNHNTMPLNTYYINRYSVLDVENYVEGQYQWLPLETLKSYVDAAIINRSWLIFTTHLRNDDMFVHNEETRQLIIELCKYAIEKGMTIQTFGEGFESFKNESEEGTIHNETYKIVDCNGVLHYKN